MLLCQHRRGYVAALRQQRRECGGTRTNQDPPHWWGLKNGSYRTDHTSALSLQRRVWGVTHTPQQGLVWGVAHTTQRWLRSVRDATSLMPQRRVWGATHVTQRRLRGERGGVVPSIWHRAACRRLQGVAHLTQRWLRNGRDATSLMPQRRVWGAAHVTQWRLRDARDGVVLSTWHRAACRRPQLPVETCQFPLSTATAATA